ncbi:MAG TPA: Co2+/Mg2+ efflux protein ApaG [Bdellovibrionales bacterium]|nr:Co2+/Mg2+ efflux protein ApaG [Bdellovibrionales bacterium]
MSSETTAGVKVEVRSTYIPEESMPENFYYFFAYTVQITNLRTEPVQLLARHWIITDGQGRVQEVKGEGVVGEQPTIEPGHTFEYSSFCPLQTTTGLMKGSYSMIDSRGQNFEVLIPEFFLVEPGSYN